MVTKGSFVRLALLLVLFIAGPVYGQLTIETWEAVLIPIFPATTEGALGSQWRTEFYVHNAGTTTAEIEGLHYICDRHYCPQPPRVEIPPGQTLIPSRSITTTASNAQASTAVMEMDRPSHKAMAMAESIYTVRCAGTAKPASSA